MGRGIRVLIGCLEGTCKLEQVGSRDVHRATDEAAAAWIHSPIHHSTKCSKAGRWRSSISCPESELIYQDSAKVASLKRANGLFPALIQTLTRIPNFLEVRRPKSWTLFDCAVFSCYNTMVFFFFSILSSTTTCLINRQNVHAVTKDAGHWRNGIRCHEVNATYLSR